MRQKNLLSVINTLILRGMGSGVSVVFVLLISRHFEVVSAAHFLLLFNLTIIASVCFRWGMDEVIVRKVSSSSQSTISFISQELMCLSHRRIFYWAFAGSIFVLATIPSSIRVLVHGITPLEAILVIFSSTMIALVACAARIRQGLGETNRATFLLNIYVPLFSLAAMLIIIANNISLSATEMILLYTVISFTGYLFTVIPYYGTPIKIIRQIKKIDKKEAVIETRAANKLGLVVLAQQALVWTALITIPWMFGEEQYKGFVVVIKIASLISLVMLAVNFTLSSRFSSLYSNKKYYELKKIIYSSALSILAASIVLFILALLFREKLFEYARIDSEMNDLLIILLLSQIFFSLAALFSIVLSMCRDDNFLVIAQSTISFFGVIFFLAAGFVSTMEVASMTFVLAYFSLASLLAWRTHRLLDLAR